ncbi:hypothetical protein [Paenibacillus puerhi]|uniref:hypothetical protein n=1 Tax=Paenibacillus puerhi TaxID=2692622 RepID=UPI001356B2EE|nr:hypothetical protein [Paenibacillus puerhi]
MLTFLVMLAAALFAGARLLTFVYYKKHDKTLAQIDGELKARFDHPGLPDNSTMS